MEATSIYGDNLVYVLREDGSLGRFHRQIHVLNPKQVGNFKKSYPKLPKNDPLDAFVIAGQLRLIFRLLNDNRLYKLPEG